MVRTPVRIEPTQPGAKLLDSRGAGRDEHGALPYELDKGESIATQQPGEWLVSFAAPAEVGRCAPTRATLQVRVTLPGHQLAIYQNQCADGRAQSESADRTGRRRGTAAVGSREVSFDLGARDVDADGRVWLLFDVHSVGAAAGSNPLSWQIQDLGMSGRRRGDWAAGPDRSRPRDDEARRRQNGEEVK
jgi:hypothetical protein